MLVCPRCFNAYVSGDRCKIDETRLRAASEINPARAVGRFETGEQIAVGRTSRVLHALDTRTQKHVALKIFHGEIAADRKLAGRLALAAKERAKLDKSCFIPVVDADLTKEGLAYIARELAGDSLSKSLHHRGARVPRAVFPVIEGIARALSKLHWTGQVYEDLRPSAVMLSGAHGKESVRLLEPGALAVLRSGAPELAAAIASDAYIAPEQVAGEKATTRSDLYVLGVLLYELLVGFPPFSKKQAHLEQPVPTIALEYCGLAELARSLLDKDPAKRPQAADAVLARLEKLGLSLSAPSLPVPKVRSRAPAMVMATGLAAAIVAGGYFFAKPVIAERMRPEEAAAPVVAEARPEPEPNVAILEPTIEEKAPEPKKVVAERPTEKPAEIKPAVVEPKVQAIAVVEKKVVEQQTPPPAAAEDALMTAYVAMDFELGRALKDKGLDFNDLMTTAPNHARQWGRWFKKDKIPSMEALAATFESLKTAADAAVTLKSRTSTASVL